jgi:hypothetical protein
MATPGELVEELADSLGVSVATIAQYDRVLAESGLRSSGGRGKSAARVTSIDAANLLITVLGTPVSGSPIKNAADTCRSYGELPVARGPSSPRRFRDFGIQSLARLPLRHSLRDALSALIAGASKGEQLEIPGDPGEAPITEGADYFLAIMCAGPQPWAHIMADVSLGDNEPNYVARLVYNMGVEHYRAFKGDLHQERHVTFRTVRRIGSVIAGETRGEPRA